MNEETEVADDSQPPQPLSKQQALEFLNEFREFTTGMDDEIDDKISQITKFIVDKLGDSNVYSFEDLQTTAPTGVYRTVKGTSARLVVMGGGVVIYLEDTRKQQALQMADDSWTTTKFTRMETESLGLQILGDYSGQNKPD